jgi:hypothetical protein
LIRLEDLKQDMLVTGLHPGGPVRLVQARLLGDASCKVAFEDREGDIHQRVLYRSSEAELQLADTQAGWAFSADPEHFKLGVEAQRIRLAHLFDPMMAVHTSNVEPLPHQITAVYESMLPRQPLRFVLADDPGLGQDRHGRAADPGTDMRADADRVLIVAPGGLVEQWRDELFEKFGLEFHIYSPQLEQASPSGNPFERLSAADRAFGPVFPERGTASKLMRSRLGSGRVRRSPQTGRPLLRLETGKDPAFRFAENCWAAHATLLLMTATPHNGKEEDFQLFLSLLDSDRFYGKFRDGVHKVRCEDLMRRMVKEELSSSTARPCSRNGAPTRSTTGCRSIEPRLYEAVTGYVQTKWGKPINSPARKGSVGFALTLPFNAGWRPAGGHLPVVQTPQGTAGKPSREEKLGIRGRVEEIAEAPIVLIGAGPRSRRPRGR